MTFRKVVVSPSVLLLLGAGSIFPAVWYLDDDDDDDEVLALAATTRNSAGAYALSSAT
jgi:hypothetical protein